MDTVPIVTLKDFGFDEANARICEGLIAHVLFDWRFWTNTHAVVLRPPARDGWVRTNFNPLSTEVDLSGVTEIAPYEDWHRGGSLWLRHDCLSDGVPRWSEGTLLDMLIVAMCRAGISIHLDSKGKKVNARLAWGAIASNATASNASQAIVRATASIIAKKEPDRRFPKLPIPC